MMPNALKRLSQHQFVLGWLLGGLLFRCIIAFWLYPGIDEAYYYVYSLHLDWSYFDHPVLVALTTGFGTWITGEVSQFTIRLGSLILYTGSLLLLYLTSTHLFNTKAARLTLAIATIIPIFKIGFGVLTLPDSPLIFFWSASLLCAAYEFFPVRAKHSRKKLSSKLSTKPNSLYSNTPHPNPHTLTPISGSYRPSYRLALLGILVGLACLGKYHGFVLGLGLVGFCLTSPRHRCALLSPWAWLGLILFIITIFPIWYWNIQHDWISFTFHLSTRFQPEPEVPQPGYNWLNVLVIVLSGIAYLFPTMALPMWWVSLRSLLAQFTGYSKTSTLESRLILWVSLPLVVGFTLLAGYHQILPTWPMPGFWGITLLLGQQAQQWQMRSPLGGHFVPSRRWVNRWLKSSAIAIASLLLFVLLHITTGTLQKSGHYALLGGFVSPKDDPSTELIDIQQLRQGFAESPVLSEALQKSSFVFSNGYYISGIVAMAISPLTSTPITCLGEDMRGFMVWFQPEQWLGKDGLYVTLERFQELTDSYRAYFQDMQEIGTVPIRRAGAVTEVFHVYWAHQMVKPYPR
ncbi:glycosyltransferase family 39 protein [Moorena sp. SIO4G3]|uniref:ArnT family glycosyltransferase n=1 Tax=Moorena sp. SIO4G3 TaxID=2607821 RepID=UPI0025EA6253|nr:glycosyltransferase family 39 protein [Moorena sp. SIO4G3]